MLYPNNSFAAERGRGAVVWLARNDAAGSNGRTAGGHVMGTPAGPVTSTVTNLIEL